MDKSKRIFFKSEEIVKQTKIGWLESEMDFRKLYHNAWRFIAPLNGVCARDFLLWVLSKIDENNMFTYSRAMYLEFVQDITEIPGGKQYEENTVHIALREFLDKGIAIKLSRGVYQLNANMFIPDSAFAPGEIKTAKQLNETQVTGIPVEFINVPEAPEDKIVNKEVSPEEGPLDKKFTQDGLFSFDSFVE